MSEFDTLPLFALLMSLLCLLRFLRRTLLPNVWGNSPYTAGVLLRLKIWETLLLIALIALTLDVSQRNGWLA